MAGRQSPAAAAQPPDVEAGRAGALSVSPQANGAAGRGALEVEPAAATAAAAADGKSEGYTGADEAHKVEHEREVLPEDEKAAKPASYFSLYRWVQGWRDGGRWRLGAAVAPELTPAAPPQWCCPAAGWGSLCRSSIGPCAHLGRCRFADRTDWLLMALGTAGAAGSGAAMPIFSILFGNL